MSKESCTACGEVLPVGSRKRDRIKHLKEHRSSLETELGKVLEELVRLGEEV